jgi:hypothetical protein
MKNYLPYLGGLFSSIAIDWFIVRRPTIDYYEKMQAEHKRNMEEIVKRLK